MYFFRNNLPNTALKLVYPVVCADVCTRVEQHFQFDFFISLIYQREFHEQKLHNISFTSRFLAGVYVVIVKDLYIQLDTWLYIMWLWSIFVACNVGYGRTHIFNVENFAMIRKYIYDFYTHIFSMRCQFSRNNLFYDEVWAGDGI